MYVLSDGVYFFTPMIIKDDYTRSVFSYSTMFIQRDVPVNYFRTYNLKISYRNIVERVLLN
jgi:hypothetical protein